MACPPVPTSTFLTHFDVLDFRGVACLLLMGGRGPRGASGCRSLSARPAHVTHAIASFNRILRPEIGQALPCGGHLSILTLGGPLFLLGGVVHAYVVVCLAYCAFCDGAGDPCADLWLSMLLPIV